MSTISRRKYRFAGLILSFVVVLSPAFARAALLIDFSRDDEGGVNPLQAGWEGMGFPATGPALVTGTFLNDTLAGAGGAVVITAEGYTHSRDYAPATGIFAAQTDLLSDGPLMNAAATMTLGVGGLLPGVYEITTYHHTTQFGPSERPANPFSISLTDAVNTDLLVADGVLMSDNGSAALSTVTFQFTSNGVDPVSISFAKGAGNDHFALPAIAIDVIPEPSTALLLAMGMFAAVIRRRSRGS